MSRRLLFGLMIASSLFVSNLIAARPPQRPAVTHQQNVQQHPQQHMPQHNRPQFNPNKGSHPQDNGRPHGPSDYVPKARPTHPGPQRTGPAMKQYFQRNSPNVTQHLHGTQHWHHHLHGAWVWGAYAFLPTANLVVDVPTGNTLRVSNGTGGTRTIRLAGVAAPGPNQAFFEESKANLARLASQHYVRIFQSGPDTDGATLAKVFLKDSGLFLNHQQILDGMAMSSIEGTFTPSLATAEDQAQEARAGMWADDAALASFDEE